MAMKLELLASLFLTDKRGFMKNLVDYYNDEYDDDFESFEKITKKVNLNPKHQTTKPNKQDEYKRKRRESAQRRQELIDDFENEFSN